jgi:ABC-type sugar transport system permease subunit
VGILLLGLAYFLPTIVGIRRRNRSAIFVLNLFLGWALVGWVVALVWAFAKDPERSGS